MPNLASEHPLIKALFNELPDTEATFSLSDRTKWLGAAESIFNLIYEYPVEVLPIPRSMIDHTKP